MSGALMGRLFDVLRNPYDKERNPSGIINLGSAENFKIDPHHCGYGEGATGSHRLRTAMARHLNCYFKPVDPVQADDISFAAGVTAINEMFGYSLADEGDGVLLNKPIYGAFENDLTTKARLKTVYVTLDGADPFNADVVEKYEEALNEAERHGTKTRVLLLSNPHNPLGQCYPPETLKALLQFCQKHQLHLVSDEVYALSVFDSGRPNALPFSSVLSIDLAGLIDTHLVHVLYGLSKDFAAGGLRLGCLVTRNMEMRQAMRAISMFHWPSSLSDLVAARILEDEAFVTKYIRLSRDRLANSYHLATGMLEEAKIAYHQGGNAGFFLWIDLSPYLPPTPDTTDSLEGERLLTKRIMDAGVYLATGEEFHSEHAGWYRIIFAQERDKLVEGLERIISIAKN
ncbi:MAG: hypothetical protein M1837_000688 [Sclerophora amabilis]|nr:MAG: hypothetical protein M1837_000688 [Sclerophora amabilis]